MAAQIFISYRRDDTADVTGRIYDRLVLAFGRNAVFKDVDSIPLGTDFRKHLESVIGECAVVLVVIGDDWMAKDAKTGALRLDNPEDFVRVEIESAIQRGLPLIPLLVEGASMPPVESLPEGPLREFAYRNGTEIGRDPNFHSQVSRLIEKLEEIFKSGPSDLVSHAPPAGQTSADVGRFSSGRKVLLLALGVLAALSAAVVVLFFAPAPNKVSQNNQAALNQRISQPTNAAAVPAAPKTSTYVNRDSKFDGELKKRFVDFSFDYPTDSWRPAPNEGPDKSYFVVLARFTPGSIGFLQERFIVTWYASTGTLDGDRIHFRQLAKELSARQSEDLPNYEKVSENETKVGPYTGYEFRFKASDVGVTFWGRVVLLPNPGHRTGVVLVMVATDHAPEFSGTDDVGLKGETPVILNSFRLGH